MYQLFEIDMTIAHGSFVEVRPVRERPKMYDYGTSLKPTITIETGSNSGHSLTTALQQALNDLLAKGYELVSLVANYPDGLGARYLAVTKRK